MTKHRKISELSVLFTDVKLLLKRENPLPIPVLLRYNFNKIASNN